MSKNFGLIGVGGFVAPRHIKAIKETGNSLVAALDKHDSVGVLDAYFPKAAFFTEFERFDRHVEKIKRTHERIDYFSICSPNYLHDAHIRFGLRNGSDVICEKPMVLNPWNIDALKQIEKESGKKVFSILQLRLHPSVIALKEKVKNSPKDKIFEFDLTYITSRGNWYYASWKGDIEKSGGIATNIGIHFFDLLIWIFGDVKKNIIHLHTHDRSAGYLEFANAKVRWFLSINENTLPTHAREHGKQTYRSIEIEGEELEFSEGFDDLHTFSYKEILSGRGFEIEESRKSIELVHEIRTKEVAGLNGDYHPFAAMPSSKHPFSGSK